MEMIFTISPFVMNFPVDNMALCMEILLSSKLQSYSREKYLLEFWLFPITSLHKYCQCLACIAARINQGEIIDAD